MLGYQLLEGIIKVWMYEGCGGKRFPVGMEVSGARGGVGDMGMGSEEAGDAMD